MRILVTGANGQVGWELSQRGAAKNFEILAFDHESLDITRAEDLRRVLNGSDVSLVINAAAYTNVEGAETEPELAFRVNCDGPGNMAGAWIGSALAIRKGAAWIRWVVVLAALLAATRMLLR